MGWPAQNPAMNDRIMRESFHVVCARQLRSTDPVRQAQRRSSILLGFVLSEWRAGHGLELLKQQGIHAATAGTAEGKP